MPVYRELHTGRETGGHTALAVPRRPAGRAGIEAQAANICFSVIFDSPLQSRKSPGFYTRALWQITLLSFFSFRRQACARPGIRGIRQPFADNISQHGRAGHNQRRNLCGGIFCPSCCYNHHRYKRGYCRPEFPACQFSFPVNFFHSISFPLPSANRFHFLFRQESLLLMLNAPRILQGTFLLPAGMAVLQRDIGCFYILF